MIFLVVTSLAVECILQTTFIEKDLKAISTPSTSVPFQDALSVALSGKTSSNFSQKENRAEQKLPSEKTKPFPSNTPSRRVGMVRGVIIPPRTQVPVQLKNPFAELCFFQNHPCPAENHLSPMAQGSWTFFQMLRCQS